MAGNLRKAIDDHCKNCCFDDLSPGTWRQQVEACNIETCSLWAVRPVSVDTKHKRRNQRGAEIPTHSLD